MPLILQIALPAPFYHCFDYLLPPECNIIHLVKGLRVRVPFGKRKLIGILITTSQETRVTKTKLKAAIEILDNTPLLPAALLELIQWASDYYHHPLGEVFAIALPTLLRQGKPAAKGRSKKPKNLYSDPVSALALNKDQQQAVEKVSAALGQFKSFLLQGVTGSGKTEVYLQIIAAVLAAGQQALVLVPEIGLTPQTVARFQQRFAVPMAVLHSGLTDRERLDAWLLAKEGIAAIIIGTRSAVFTPLLKPGIIIIDEEHDASFKQQEGLRYSARDLALVRGRLENIPVLLGSATPSLESLYNVQQNRYALLTLPERAGTAALPAFRLIDLRNQKLESGLSAELLAVMDRHLKNKGQVLLFLNRRGFAPVLICHACGWVAACHRCDAKLTYHQHPPLLQCHHCGSARMIDKTCPTCHSEYLLPFGLGTQRIEQSLVKHFPATGIVRIDRDSTRRKGSLQAILETIHAGENQILIGTQMLAKGHHFPAVTLVAILDADVGLFSADFRAGERTAQLLIQVAGRAGRAEQPGEVLIQTHNPDHLLLQQLLKQDYRGFAAMALNERQAAEWPPYAYLALFRAEAVAKEAATTFLKQLQELARSAQIPGVTLLGPIPCLIERRAGRYRSQLLVQALRRDVLHKLLNYLVPRIETLASARRVRWSLDVDPIEMM